MNGNQIERRHFLNLAGDPQFAGTIQKLRVRLTDYLGTTRDPRFCDLPVRFDEYPYRP